MIEYLAYARAQRSAHYAMLPRWRKVVYVLGSMLGCTLVAALLTLIALNGAMGCDRDHPDYCLVIHHAWEAGL